jgi:predicted transcriptional regulator
MNESTEMQKNICDIIAKNPGIHLSKIAELLDIKIAVIEQQLRNLEINERITSIEIDGYKRYYFEDKRSGIRDKRIKETRKQLFELIATNPGLHLSKIAEMLKMRLSLAEYHLQYMEKNKLITSVKDVGYYKRYYVAGDEVGIQKRKIISLLREEIPLKIVLFLLKHSRAKHKEILENFEITSSTLSYHLNKLAKHGIIDIPMRGDTGYNIKNKEEIIALLKEYRLIPLTKSFTEIWDDLKFK